MRHLNPFSSFEPEDSDLREESTSPVSRASSPFVQPPFPPMATTPLPDPFSGSLPEIGGQAGSAFTPHSGRYTSGHLPAVRSTYRSGQSPFAHTPENESDSGASRSLISALQSTMMPSSTSARQPVVIPGIPDGRPRV